MNPPKAPLPERPRLMDQVRERLRVKHYSTRTEQVCTDWTKRFILFQGKRHPEAMGAEEIEAFLSDHGVKSNGSFFSLPCQKNRLDDFALGHLRSSNRPMRKSRIPTVR